MKKFVLLLLLCFGLSSVGFSQAAGKGGAERGKESKVKPRGQMRHFDKPPRDRKMKHNGTRYKKKKSEHKVDGDGFSNSPGKGRRRKKK